MKDRHWKSDTISDVTELATRVSKVQSGICEHDNYIGVEYEYGHPARYDGISEFQCRDCGYRWGRWSGKELKEGEFEHRWGIDSTKEGADNLGK